MTVDGAGRLWVALWNGSAVRCYDPDGTVVRQLDVPAPRPTSVCLADGRLYLTTAAAGLDDPGPASGAVLAIDVDATAPPAAAYRPAVDPPRAVRGGVTTYSAVTRPQIRHSARRPRAVRGGASL